MGRIRWPCQTKVHFPRSQDLLDLSRSLVFGLPGRDKVQFLARGRRVDFSLPFSGQGKVCSRSNSHPSLRCTFLPPLWPTFPQFSFRDTLFLRKGRHCWSATFGQQGSSRVRAQVRPEITIFVLPLLSNGKTRDDNKGFLASTSILYSGNVSIWRTTRTIHAMGHFERYLSK